MAASKRTSPMHALFVSARRHPDVEEGIACAGTTIESRTLQVRGKAFAFLRPGNVMLKLRDALGEARAMAAKAPQRIKVGASGWVTITSADDDQPPVDVLRRWLDESYALFAAKPAATKTRGAKIRQQKTAQRKANEKKANPKKANQKAAPRRRR